MKHYRPLRLGDPVLFALVVALSIFGIAMIYSAGVVDVPGTRVEGTWRQQLLWFSLAMLLIPLILRIPVGVLEWGSQPVYALGLVLLLAARRMRAGWAAGLGLALGVLDGAAHPLTMGAGAVALAVLGYLGARSREFLSGDSPVVLALYLFAGKWIYDVLMWVLLLRFNLSGPVTMLLMVSPLAAAYAAAVGLAAAAAYRSVA